MGLVSFRRASLDGLARVSDLSLRTVVVGIWGGSFSGSLSVEELLRFRGVSRGSIESSLRSMRRGVTGLVVYEVVVGVYADA